MSVSKPQLAQTIPGNDQVIPQAPPHRHFTRRFSWLLAFAGFDLPTRLPDVFLFFCAARAFQAKGLCESVFCLIMVKVN